MTAFFGTINGDTTLFLSFLSLKLISFKIRLYIDFSPCSINCLCRLFALISGLTSMKSFILAFLKTLDPMSRPSITQPFLDLSIFFTINFCWLLINFLTIGIVAIIEVCLLIISFLRVLCFFKDKYFNEFKKKIIHFYYLNLFFF